VLEHARTRFEEAVARPALRTTRGQPRIRALFEYWIAWDAHPGGSPFVAASTEFDDQPGRCGTASSATTGTYWTWSLYLNPPDKAIMLCGREVADLSPGPDRAGPPDPTGVPEKQTHDYMGRHHDPVRRVGGLVASDKRGR
jgi:hypothetical protein